MGSLRVSSQTKAATSPITDTAAQATMKCDSNQSSRWPLSRTTCRNPRPTLSRPSPMKSILTPDLNPLRTRNGGSKIRKKVRISEITPTGMLMRKIHRQL